MSTGEWHGTNAFTRDDDRVLRTYFINNRGDEALGSTWSYLDLTALGRQEGREDSPEGYPQGSPYAWWSWHDEAPQTGVDRLASCSYGSRRGCGHDGASPSLGDGSEAARIFSVDLGGIRTMHGRLRLALCSVLVVAGCSGGRSHPAAAPTTRTSPGTTVSAARTGWTRSDLTPVSQPEVSGARFVLYTAAQGSLEVIALDPATGRTSWELPASSGFITAGLSPVLGVFGDTVTFLQPAGTNQVSKLVGVDAGTGAVRWTTPPAGFSDWPKPCADDTSAVCATANSANTIRLLRFRASDGTPSPAPVIPTAGRTRIAREVGPDLFDPGARSPEQLVATNGPSVIWRRPLATVFAGTGYSTDNGWSFDRIPAIGLFVGSVGGPPLNASATQMSRDLSRIISAGFRISDGTITWTNAGSLYVCGPIRCPGQTQTAGGVSPYHPPTLGLRLRMTGTTTFSQGKAALDPGAKVVLEGFDLSTGVTTWSFDAGADTTLARGISPPRIASDTVILPNAVGDPTVVDLTTGRQSALAPATTAWCRTATNYAGPPHDAGNGRTSTDYVGNPALFPCNAAGQPMPVPSQLAAFVAPASGGVMAWSETTRVEAVPAG